MRNVFGVSRFSAYAVVGARIAPVLIALLACLIWASAAHAQSAPFNSQYGEPPTSPPEECAAVDGSASSGSAPSSDDPSGEASDPAENCEPRDLESSSEEGTVDVLPTTGGVFLAPLFLGLAVVGATATVAVRRKR